MHLASSNFAFISRGSVEDVFGAICISMYYFDADVFARVGDALLALIGNFNLIQCKQLFFVSAQKICMNTFCFQNILRTEQKIFLRRKTFCFHNNDKSFTLR